MLIKEEPASPGVQGRGEGVPLGPCEVCAEPPVLPVAMVQSVLDGRVSSLGERRIKRPMLERYNTIMQQNFFINYLSYKFLLNRYDLRLLRF